MGSILSYCVHHTLFKRGHWCLYSTLKRPVWRVRSLLAFLSHQRHHGKKEPLTGEITPGAAVPMKGAANATKKQGYVVCALHCQHEWAKIGGGVLWSRVGNMMPTGRSGCMVTTYHPMKCMYTSRWCREPRDFGRAVQKQQW